VGAASTAGGAMLSPTAQYWYHYLVSITGASTVERHAFFLLLHNAVGRYLH
jgi:hypothetical protein